jgi:hypothetical protein
MLSDEKEDLPVFPGYSRDGAGIWGGKKAIH